MSDRMNVVGVIEPNTVDYKRWGVIEFPSLSCVGVAAAVSVFVRRAVSVKCNLLVCGGVMVEFHKGCQPLDCCSMRSF